MTPSDEPVADDPTVSDPVSDRAFAAALTRASAEPPADLVARMQTVSRRAVDETHPRMRRRWTVALVAASLLMVVGAGVLVARTGGDGGAGPADAPTLDGNYLPTEWPAQLTSTISIGEVPATAMFGSWALLVRESTPDTWNVAGVAHLDHAGPLSQRNAQSDLDVWSVSDVISGVDVTLYTRDSTLSAELEALLGQLTLSNLGEGRAPTLATVPDGWAWVPMLDVDAPSAVDSADAAELTAFTGWAQGGPGVGSAQRSSGDGRYRAGITTVRVADPQQVVEAIAALAGPSVSPVEIGEGVEGVIIRQVTSSSGQSLVFAPEPASAMMTSLRLLGHRDRWTQRNGIDSGCPRSTSCPTQCVLRSRRVRPGSPKRPKPTEPADSGVLGSRSSLPSCSG